MVPGTGAPERLGTTRLGDGRRLAWSEWGPPDGVAVLLFPGAATSRRLGFGTEVLHPRGVRLVSVDRPGLGGSDPDPHRDLAGWAADVGELVRARGLRDPCGVAFSQGAPFALACAAAGHLRALAVVSGSDEIAAPALRALLPAPLRDLVDLCAQDPSAAEALFASTAGAEAMWGTVMAMSGPGDRELYAEPRFAAAYRRALEEAFAQGPGGYARDTRLAMSPWPFDVARLDVPVDLWFGALDASPVHSPDLGRSLHARIPGSRRHLVEGEGAAVLWTRGPQILDALLQRAGRSSAGTESPSSLVRNSARSCTVEA